MYVCMYVFREREGERVREREREGEIDRIKQGQWKAWRRLCARECAKETKGVR